MYSYETEKKELFTDAGQRMFLCIRDNVNKLLKQAGAMRMQEAMNDSGGGSSWAMIACIDRLVELGEIREVTNRDKVATQFAVFVRAR